MRQIINILILLPVISCRYSASDFPPSYLIVWDVSSSTEDILKYVLEFKLGINSPLEKYIFLNSISINIVATVFIWLL